jgi:hypothetical protein
VQGHSVLDDDGSRLSLTRSEGQGMLILKYLEIGKEWAGVCILSHRHPVLYDDNNDIHCVTLDNARYHAWGSFMLHCTQN